MDREKFFKSLRFAGEYGNSGGGIGTLSEKCLHSTLKYYFEPDRMKHEIKVGNYIADVFNEHGITEIQTRNLFTLKKKIEAFLPIANVRVVFPIAQKLWNCWVDPNTGEIIQRKKSPKKVSEYYILSELYSLKKYIPEKRFSVCAIMLEVEDYRCLDGYGKHKKIRASHLDRVPVDIFGETHLTCVSDYRQLVPQKLPDEFTVKDFAVCAGVRLPDAGKAVNLMREIGVFIRVGKIGKMYTYRTVN